jgi:HAD superfamily hydrolase (TIGR01509 family)
MPKISPNTGLKIDVRGKILLFDFDGTMVATEGLAKQVVETYFDQKKPAGQASIADKIPFSEMIVGRTWKAATENMVTLAKSHGYDIDPPDALVREFKARYREKFEKGVQLIPGLLEKLPELQAKAKFMGIVTGSEHDEVATILKAHGLGTFFSRVWAFGDYEHSKPHPSPFLTAMRDLQCTPAEVFVFEDSKAGMESAHLAGIPWVQIAFEAHAIEPDVRSVCVIRNWADLQLL